MEIACKRIIYAKKEVAMQISDNCFFKAFHGLERLLQQDHIILGYDAGYFINEEYGIYAKKPQLPQRWLIVQFLFKKPAPDKMFLARKITCDDTVRYE